MAEYLQNSFIGGEISEKLLGRTDIEAYFRSAKKIENFLVSLEGGVTCRAGFQYLTEVNNEEETQGVPRLFEYIYSQDISFVVVMQDQHLWVFDTDGVEKKHIANTGYTTEAVWELKYAQNGRFMYFADGFFPETGVNNKVKKLSYDGTDWTFGSVEFASTGITGRGLSLYTRVLGTAGTTKYRYKVCAMNSNTGFVSMPLNGNGLEDTDYVITTTGNATLSSTNFVRIHMSFDIGTVSTTAGSPNVTGVGTLFQSSIVGKTIIINAVSYVVASRTSDTAIALTTNAASNLSGVFYETLDGRANRDLFLKEFDAFLIFKEVTLNNNNTYRMAGSYVKILPNSNTTIFNDVGLEPTSEIVPSPFDDFSATNGYPSTISFMQDRLLVASTPEFPLNIYMSAAGAYEDLTYRFASGNGRGLMLTMATPEKNEIKYIVEVGKTVLLTDGAIYRFGTYQDSAISHTNIPTLKKQYNFGVCDIKPIVVGNRIIFINKSMKEIRDLVYNYQTDSFDGNELSYFVPQLIGEHKLIDSIYQHNPHRVLWYVREDGVLLGMTYSTELKTFAWHRHTIGGGGKVKSVTSVPSDREDKLFTIIEFNGKYYLTKMMDNIFVTKDIVESHYLDLATITDLREEVEEEDQTTDTITGLDHLEGEEVSVLADGSYLGEFVVDGGGITLPDAYSYIVVGKKYTSELETIDLNIPSKNVMFRYKNIHTVNVKTEKSSTYQIGEYSTNLKYEYYDIAPSFNVGDFASNSIKVSNNWSKPSNIVIKKDHPLPLNINCIEVEFSVGGK